MLQSSLLPKQPWILVWFPHSFSPLRKCVPKTGQLRGQCGHAVMVPHITKVLWCQHNHVVCTVTSIRKAALLGFSVPVYWAIRVRIMNDGTQYPSSCQNVTWWAMLSSSSHTDHSAYPIIQDDLMVIFPLVTSLSLAHKRADFRPPTKCAHRHHKAKLFTKHDPDQDRKCGNNQFMRFTQASPFYNLNYWHLWLIGDRATELALSLWEKDKRPAESVKIGAPVFITLVYRLNSPLLSRSAKYPRDLFFSSSHLKQFIKNE